MVGLLGTSASFCHRDRRYPIPFSFPPSYLWAVLMAGAFLAAYIVWHYRGSSLLAMEYRRRLFGDSTLSTLNYPPAHTPTNTRWPQLLINCAVLNSGHSAVFTNDHPITGPEWTKKRGGGFAGGLRLAALGRAMAPSRCRMTRLLRRRLRHRRVSLGHLHPFDSLRRIMQSMYWEAFGI